MWNEASMSSRRKWPLVQMGGALMGAPVIAWTSHFYVAHESDQVTLMAWGAYAIVVGLLCGFLPIVASALLGFANLKPSVAKGLGWCGALQACVLYLGGLWVFVFRYPPHWSLLVMEAVAALGALLALTAAIVRFREPNWRRATQL